MYFIQVPAHELYVSNISPNRMNVSKAKHNFIPKIII